MVTYFFSYYHHVFHQILTIKFKQTKYHEAVDEIYRCRLTIWLSWGYMLTYEIEDPRVTSEKKLGRSEWCMKADLVRYIPLFS